MADESKNGGPNYVAAYREAAGLTQEELGQRIDTTASVVSLLESGSRKLDARWLRKLSRVLDVPIDHLLNKPPGEAGPIAEVIQIWDRIDARDKARVITVLKSFASGD